MSQAAAKQRKTADVEDELADYTEEVDAIVIPEKNCKNASVSSLD